MPDNIGRESADIHVELSTRFLEHFSEHMYSSPQKAFEELISNGWDAGADYVDVRVSSDLQLPNATMSVLDNGSSMDEEGLRQLWRIAFSPKTDNAVQHGRQVIGKFGIGKLATYVLASKLTYICKAADGVIRRVTMNYDSLNSTENGSQDRLINDIDLKIFEATEDEVKEALAAVYDGPITYGLIESNIPRPQDFIEDDEYGAGLTQISRASSGTWTLVVLSDLKPTGRSLKLGVLRRMLKAALPIGSSMAIKVNGELLASSKINVPITKEWTIGPELKISSIELKDDFDLDDLADESKSPNTSPDAPLAIKIDLSSSLFPHPSIDIPDVGTVTGHVWLYNDEISGGKSSQRGSSNGFFVNVLGRVVNLADPTFGEKNLSHAAWARFRMTIRADGLNDLLTTDREKLK